MLRSYLEQAGYVGDYLVDAAKSPTVAEYLSWGFKLSQELKDVLLVCAGWRITVAETTSGQAAFDVEFLDSARLNELFSPETIQDYEQKFGLVGLVPFAVSHDGIVELFKDHLQRVVAVAYRSEVITYGGRSFKASVDAWLSGKKNARINQGKPFRDS
ncbi:MAG: hypothetical protein Q4D85_02005 [Corynebacterium sp.]|nr:hypothetical protein [Corynebacterium sp.]